MSEQDFFFDEEPETAAEQPKPKNTRAKTDDAAPVKRTAPKAAKQSEPEPVAVPYESQMTTWSVAILLALVGLLLGAILGFFLGSALGKPATTTGTSTAPIGQTAPTDGTPSTLTSEQISGGLPAGHPDISNTSTETTGK